MATLRIFPTLAVLVSALLLQPRSWAETDAQTLGGQNLTFTVAGDYGANSDAAATLDAVAALRPAFHLAIGDLSYDQLKPETAWCDFVKEHVGDQLPFELLAGNREGLVPDPNEPGVGDISAFAACLPDRLGTINGEYGQEYYFDYPVQAPLARFIFLSPGLTFADGSGAYTRGHPHYEWAAATIDDARKRQIPWVIVSMHKPCLTLGHQPCSSVELLNLLLQRQVDLVLSGHEHTYQRSKQLAVDPSTCAWVESDRYDPRCVADEAAATVTKGRGPVFVVVGTGGAGNAELDPASPIADYFVTSMGSNANSTYGLLAVDLSQDSLQGRFVRASGGDFEDHFAIQNPGP